MASQPGLSSIAYPIGKTSKNQRQQRAAWPDMQGDDQASAKTSVPCPQFRLLRPVRNDDDWTPQFGVWGQ
jgi:hypothetical protein